MMAHLLWTGGALHLWPDRTTFSIIISLILRYLNSFPIFYLLPLVSLMCPFRVKTVDGSARKTWLESIPRLTEICCCRFDDFPCNFFDARQERSKSRFHDAENLFFFLLTNNTDEASPGAHSALVKWLKIWCVRRKGLKNLSLLDLESWFILKRTHSFHFSLYH